MKRASIPEGRVAGLSVMHKIDKGFKSFVQAYSLTVHCVVFASTYFTFCFFIC